MTDDWLQDDPFADPADPAAREREERRREREERRRKRDSKRKKDPAPAPVKPQAPAEPPPPPRTPEEEFWDEEPDRVVEERPPVEEPLVEPSKHDEPPVVEPPLAEPPAAQPPAGEPRPAAPPAAGSLPAEPSPADRQAAAREAWTAPRQQRDWDFDDEGDPETAAPGRRSWRGGGRKGGDGRGPGLLGSLARHPFRIAGIVLALIVVWFLFSLFQPFHGDGSGKVQVTVPKGSSVSEVADLLAGKGVIDSSDLFQIRVTIAGKRSDLYAGHFTLAKGMSYGAAMDALSTPPVKRTTTVTIPEGYSRTQAARLVAEDGVPGSYAKATVKSKYLNPATYGAKNAGDLEGFLFPDTFEMKPNAPVADLVQLQLKDFKKRIKGVDMAYAKSKNLTVYDVLIIASMIEDEAGVASQRKQVASVIYNRLKEGRPLGIDATTRFATGNYTDPLTESELAIDSPYNTRANLGLPPGPINSPGLEAIEAAAHPAKNDFIFYVTEPGACGKLAFSSSEAEWERDVQRYESAREAAGGNSPDSCGE
jgi:uncharacterized YceG family protein